MKGISQQLTTRTRRNLAIQHLLAASLFSRRVGEIETANATQPFGAFFEEIIAYSSACAHSCVAGMEAYANELFIDGDQNFPTVPPDKVEEVWESSNRADFFDKFDAALALLQLPKLDQGKRPAQDVLALIRLRNALTHFKPEWDDENAEHATLSKLLKDRISGSPHFLTEHMFPMRWMTHEGTRWAVNSSIQFLGEFEKTAAIKSKLDQFRTRLTP